MHIGEILKTHNPAFSFEFYPPKNQESEQELILTLKALNKLRPAYISVTYGAGGSTRDFTHQFLKKIIEMTDLTVVSHLTCVNHTTTEIHNIIEQYDQDGIKNILALRGDPPRGQWDFQARSSGFSYANELVAYIKKHFPHMGIGVAGFPEGHPQTPNRLKEMEFLKQKVDAGADYICTQLFFDNRDFLDFRERCRISGIKVPIIAGIMPITSINGMRRMMELALGSRIPASLLKAVYRAESDQLVEKVGIHWTSEQVRDLLDNNVDGIHFFTLNKSDATRKIYEGLGVSTSKSLSS